MLNYISNFKDESTSGDFPYKVESVYYCKNCSTFLCKNCNETRVEKESNKILNSTNEEDFKENAKVKYDKITKILNVCNYNQKSANNRLNKLFCNKIFTLIAFFAIFSLIFILTFGSFGHYLSSFLGSAFERIVNLIFPNLKFQTSNPIVSFVYDGLFGGVVSILSFLPQIALLFFFINLLDDVGILSRFAFMFDEFFQKFGLSGRSVFNIMMGFGCTTSAIFTTRNIADEKIRKRTALVLPNFSCSAKLPIYACICSAFFAGQKVLVIFELYLIGVLVGLIIAIILKKISKTKTESTFIMEMPKLRFPRIRKILQDAIRSVRDFIIRIGSIILVMSVIVWFISNFTFSLSFEPDSDKIILNVIGSVLSPIFAPLGFGLASIIVALITGLFAKEMIVASLILSNGVTSIGLLSSSLFNSISPAHFTAASAIAFLVFVLLYPTCVSAFGAMRKEFGLKTALTSFAIQLIIAYSVSFLTYKLASFGLGAMGSLIAIALTFAIMAIFMVKLTRDKNYDKLSKIYNKRKNKAFKVA